MDLLALNPFGRYLEPMQADQQRLEFHGIQRPRTPAPFTVKPPTRAVAENGWLACERIFV